MLVIVVAELFVTVGVRVILELRVGMLASRRVFVSVGVTMRVGVLVDVIMLVGFPIGVSVGVPMAVAVLGIVVVGMRIVSGDTSRQAEGNGGKNDGNQNGISHGVAP